MTETTCFPRRPAPPSWLLLRLVAGDLAAWRVGGMLNELALPLFVGATCIAVVHRRRRRTTGPAPTTYWPLAAAVDTLRGTQP